MSNPLMRADIANAVASGMDDVFWDSADDTPEQYKEIFGEEEMEGQFFQAVPFYGFGQVPKSGENIPLTYDSPGEGYKSTVEADVYKLACRISREAYKDERYGMLKATPKELAKSFRYTKNVTVANMFNNGFSASYLYADGMPLFGDATAFTHPLKTGGTDYNQPTTGTADLNATTLMSAMVDLRRTLDDRGKLWNIGILSYGITLFVPLELEATAWGLVKSEKDPESAKNTVNWFNKQKITPKVGDFLTDPNAWFLVASPKLHRVKVFNRELLDTDSDREFSTGSLLFSGYERYTTYAETWRGTWGSAGH